MSGRLKIPYPVVVEGRYDKIKLQSIIDAHIVTTDGFGVFNSAQKRELLRKLCGGGRIIVLTDSDGAGLLIRSHLRSVLPQERVIHLYAPRVAGKERRKKSPSREGVLGVEGMDADLLRGLFAPWADGSAPPRDTAHLTKADFYADGLSGKSGSAAKRAALSAELGLPGNLSANALLEAIDMTCTEAEYRAALNKIDKVEENG